MDDFDHSMHISDHDWLSFVEESEECCLLQASLACPDSSGLSDADDPDFTTQNCTPKQVDQAGEDSTEHGVCSIAQCSMDADGKGGSDPIFDPGRVLEDAHGEKERWFVSVNDKTSPQLASATASVVKKKRRNQKKICKVDCTYGDKVNTCGDIDKTTQVKFPEPKYSDTDTNAECETDASTTHLEAACKGDRSGFLNIENDGEQINIKHDFNQVKRPDTMLTQEMGFESVLIQEADRICPGYSTLNNTSQPREIKCGTCNEITNSVKDLVFVQEKDRDVRSESSKTQVTMDLTCSQHSQVHLDTSNSTNVHNSTCADTTKQEENIDTGVEDCGNEGHLQNILTKTTKTDISSSFDVMNQTSNFDTGAIPKDHSKINNLGCFGAPCKDGSLDLTLDTAAEAGVISGRPTDNPSTSTNSVESDEFTDYESFSSCSYDSETYHSAADSVEDSRHFKQYESSIDRAHMFLPVSPSNDITPNDISTCTIGTESTALCLSIASHTSADNSTTSLADHSESSLPKLHVTMESPEAYAKATGNSQPVYAISAFWDEMEKLTINDILQIRMGRCMLPIEEAVTVDGISTYINNASTEIVHSVNLPQSGTLDTLDAADSDYCTNLDESKPDCSSCDFSTSDFEEEYWQFINSSRNSSPDQHDKSYQSECMDCVCEGEESDDIGTPVPSEDCSGDKCSCDSTFNLYDLAIPQQMRKNKSMYDIHAPKSMEDLSTQSFFDLGSCKSLEEPLKLSDSFEVVAPIMCLTDEQYQISFPKVFEYLFDDNKAACEAMSVSVYGLQGNCASPFNDYTFSTETNDLPVMPYIEEPIPIFSCSRPTVRELTFPKPGCIFLGTSFTTMKDVSPIQIVSQSILRGMNCKQTDRSFTFSQDLSSLYSVKKISFLDKASDVWRYEAEDEEKPVFAIDSNVTVVNEGGVLALTQKMFKEAAFAQISMEKNQMPTDYQNIFSKIKQSDMCLVCIAFASWVLRSSDPEAADAWKAALLANVSALSAIQYLRQYMKKKNSALDG